jgi:hypothetical protein
MLRHASQIEGYGINATDGPIGTIVDFLFDDETWLVRWLVVDTGAFLTGRKVLLPPSALSHINHMGGELAVGLTKQQVKDSPDIKTDEPVSRVMESDVYDFYGWSPYWSTGFYMGGYAYPVEPGFLPGGLGPHDVATSDREGAVGRGTTCTHAMAKSATSPTSFSRTAIGAFIILLSILKIGGQQRRS